MMQKSHVCKSKEELTQWLKESCQPGGQVILPGTWDYPCVAVITTNDGWLSDYVFVHYNEFQKARYVTE